jgi:hypothetical protein
MTWSEIFFAMVGRGCRGYYGIEIGGWIRVGWEGGSVDLDERDIRRHRVKSFKWLVAFAAVIKNKNVTI